MKISFLYSLFIIGLVFGQDVYAIPSGGRFVARYYHGNPNPNGGGPGPGDNGSGDDNGRNEGSSDGQSDGNNGYGGSEINGRIGGDGNRDSGSIASNQGLGGGHYGNKIQRYGGGGVKFWRGFFLGISFAYYVPIIANNGENKNGDILKAWQLEALPNNVSTITSSCFPSNRDDVCVYPDPEAHELVHDHTMSQIKIILNTFQYVNASATRFQVSLDVHCSKTDSQTNWVYLGLTNEFTSDKNYTKILTETGKCSTKSKRKPIVDSFRISFQQDNIQYHCGKPRPVCDFQQKLAKQKCERVDTFTPVFIDLVKDCGVPPNKLIPPV